jgi:hypothetical protein
MYIAVKLSIFLELSLEEEFLLPVPVFLYDVLFERNRVGQMD